MKYLLLTFGLLAAVFCSAGPSLAQLNPPNSIGVTVGHMHLNVSDVEAAKKFYLELGGTAIKFNAFEGVKYPGVILLFRKADPTTGSEGSTVNHIGFLVKDGAAIMAKMKAEGMKIASNGSDWRGGFVYSPDGVKVEIVDRPNLPVPIQFDQIHFFAGGEAPNGGAGWAELQKWYAKEFGVTIQRSELVATPGNKFSSPNAQSNLAGVTLRFSMQDSKAAPTQGRALDHIGFEIKNLGEFCKKLEADGVKFDTPYSVREGGLGLAFVTDPMGTRIELNEGLGKI